MHAYQSSANKMISNIIWHWLLNVKVKVINMSMTSIIIMGSSHYHHNRFGCGLLPPRGYHYLGTSRDSNDVHVPIVVYLFQQLRHDYDTVKSSKKFWRKEMPTVTFLPNGTRCVNLNQFLNGYESNRVINVLLSCCDCHATCHCLYYVLTSWPSS